MSVILQAAFSGESGEEWSTLDCNTEYSHGIMCYVYVSGIEVSVWSQCFVGKKILLSDCKHPARIMNTVFLLYDTFHYKNTVKAIAQSANSSFAVSALIYRNTHIIKHIM